MITLFVLALVLLGAYYAVTKVSLMDNVAGNEWDEGSRRYKVVEVERNPFYGNGIKIPLLILAGFSLILFISSGALDAKEGKKYAIYDKFGGERMIDTQGLKFIWPLSRVKEWNNYIDVKVPSGEETEEALTELEGIMKPIPLLFVDKVTATASPTVRFAIPTDKVNFLAMDKEFRSVGNLVENTLKPSISEMMVSAGYMFSAEDYVSGEAQNFRQTFEEHMLNGAYKVKKVTTRDTTFDISAKDNKFKIKAIKTSYSVKKVLDANGDPIVVENEFIKNNIKVVQVTLPKVALDPGFNKRLIAQRDESTKRQLFVQQTKSAKDERELIIARGEKDKADKKVEQELLAVTRITKAAALVIEEQKAKELSVVKLSRAKVDAQTVKVQADAEAYAIAKKVRAGITPEVELQMRLDADVAKVVAISKLKLPETMFMGSSGGNDGILSQLIGADIAKSMKGTTK